MTKLTFSTLPLFIPLIAADVIFDITFMARITLQPKMVFRSFIGMTGGARYSRFITVIGTDRRPIMAADIGTSFYFGIIMGKPGATLTPWTKFYVGFPVKMFGGKNVGRNRMMAIVASGRRI